MYARTAAYPLRLFGALLPLLGCASVPAPAPVIEAPHAPEMRALPPDPAQEVLPQGTPPGEWVTSLEAGSCYDREGLHGGDVACPPRSGILSSEARAARDGLYRIRYRELRTFYEADRTTWSAQRELYETLIQHQRAQIRAQEPAWFDRNALPLGIIAGVLVGAGGVSAIALLVR